MFLSWQYLKTVINYIASVNYPSLSIYLSHIPVKCVIDFVPVYTFIVLMTEFSNELWLTNIIRQSFYNSIYLVFWFTP